MKNILFYLVLVCVMCSFALHNAHAQDIEMKVLRTTERKDRVIDRAAVGIQREAIKRIESILNNPMHRSKEADLLFQLAIARLDAASIQFRISHEIAHRSDSKLDLGSYNNEMSEAIKVLSRLLKSHPRDPRVPEVLFLRGTAHDETKQVQLAKKDFEELVKRFPEVPETSSAYMRLSDFAVEDENHALALTYLKPMEGRPNDAFYPFALYKTAWAHFNLHQIRSALDYLGKHIKFYDDKFQKIGGLESSEMAIRDNSLRDISLFYVEGLQRGRAGFNLDSSFNEFRKYAGLNPIDPIIVRFTSLLRARNEQGELEQWARKIDQSELRVQTKLSVLNILFENQNNRRLYSEMRPNLERLTRLISENPELETSDAASDLKKIVDQGAQDLHKAINDNKSSPEVAKLLNSLEDIYGLVIILSVKDKSDSVKSYYNLAETYFELKNYTKSSHFYELARKARLEIADSKKKKDPDSEIISAKELHLRAIAAQFEYLKSVRVIPKDLKTQKLGNLPASQLPVELVAWETTLGKLPGLYNLNEDEKLVLRRYLWEAQRARYSRGQVSEVVGEFYDELQKHDSLDEIRSPKLALLMDTLVLSEKWNDLHDLTKKWNKNPSVKKLDLADKMKELESDSFLKQLEANFKSNQYDQVLAQADQCKKLYSDEEAKVLKCQIFKAEVLLARMQHSELLNVLEGLPVVEGDLRIKTRINEMKEESYFAQQKYEKLYDLVVENQSNDLDKILDITFMIQEARVYRSTLNHKQFCQKKSEECRMLRALLKLRGDQDDFSIKFSEIFRAHRPYRSVYSLASVSSFRSSLGDRMKVLRNSFDSWKDLDSSVYWSVLPHLGAWLDAELEENRRLLQRNYPIRANSPDSLLTRFARVKDFEESLELLSKNLPFSFLRNKVLSGASGSLDDLIVEMKDVLGEDSKEFVGPLSTKKQKLDTQINVFAGDKIESINGRLKALAVHAMSPDVTKIINDLNADRWVAAKTQQNESLKAKKLPNLAAAWIDANFFLKLEAYEEALVSLQLVEDELNKHILSQQQIVKAERGSR